MVPFEVNRKEMINALVGKVSFLRVSTATLILLTRDTRTLTKGVFNEDGWRSVRVPNEDGEGSRGDDKSNARLGVGNVTMADALSFPSCVWAGAGCYQMRKCNEYVTPGVSKSTI